MEQPSHSLVSRTVVIAVALLLLASLIGFFPGYLAEFPRFEHSGWQVHFHLLTILAWLGMLVAQAWLASSGRIESHRRLGRLSYVLVPLVVLGFLLVTSFGQQRNPQPQLLAATLFDGSMFLSFYLLAIIHRRDSAQHSRYMALTALALMNPPLGRAIAPEFSVTLQFVGLVALLVHAKRRDRPWRPYLVGLIVYLSVTALVVFVSLVRPEILDWVWQLAFGA